MNNKSIIELFNNVIVDIYKSEKLNCLRGLDSSYIVNGKNILEWHSNVTKNNSKKFHNPKFYMTNLAELILCSDAILYYTAQLFLYRPYMNNPLNEFFLTGKHKTFTNFQNLEAKRYLMTVDIVSEKFYNYWDRIGDLIGSYFPDKVPPERIFFPTSIDIIPKKYHDSEHFQWLKTFKDSDYKILNQRRRQSVHYISADTTFSQNHINYITNEDEMKKIVDERYQFYDFYKNHLYLAIDGYYHTLSLLEIIDSVI